MGSKIIIPKSNGEKLEIVVRDSTRIIFNSLKQSEKNRVQAKVDRGMPMVNALVEFFREVKR